MGALFLCQLACLFLIENWSVHMNDSLIVNKQEIPIFFIIGRPRSGTTLIRTLLDAHPNVIVPPEYPVIPDLIHRFGLHPRWTPELKKEFLQAFKQPQTFEFWNYDYLQIDEQALLKDLDELPIDTPMTSAIKLFYLHSKSVFPKQEIQWIGDKNPVYALYTRLLMKWFPEAKFLFIIRDPRDNFVSMKKFDWEAPNPVIQAWRWKYITKMMFQLHQKYPERTFLFRYEDLASKPRNLFKKICNFLDIDDDENVFEFYRISGQENLGFIERETFLKYHESLTKPINTDTIGKWEYELQPNDIEILELVAGKWLERAGYQRRYTKKSIILPIKTSPFVIYSWLLYKLMLAGENIPYSLKVKLSRFLPSLARIYGKVVKLKK